MPPEPTAGPAAEPRCLYLACPGRPVLGPLCEFHRPGWRELADCRGSDLDLWYSTAAASIDTARGYCHGCPVRALCLEDALDAEYGLPASKRFGTRAGLTPAERATTPTPASTPQHAH